MKQLQSLFHSPYLLLALVPLLWSGNFIVGRVIAAEIPPLAISTARWLIAALFLLPLTYRQEKGWPKVDSTVLGPLILMGFTGVFAYNTLVYWGLKYTTSINGTLVSSALPIVTIFLSALILKEKTTRRQVVGALITMVGVAWILSRGSWAALAGLEFNPGDVVIFLDTLVWGLFTVMGKKVMGKLSPLTSTTYSVLIGLILLIPAAVIESSFTPPWALSWKAVAGFLYIGIMASVVAMVWWNKGIAALGAGQAGMFTNLMPLYTAFLAIWFLGEGIGGAQIFGGLLVIIGVYLGVIQKNGVISKISELLKGILRYQSK